MGKGTKNFDPSSMVDDQQQETSSTVLNDNEGGKRQYTWAEIRRHSSKKDRWLVINKRVYDITKWFKHPGGQALLNHYAGQDATEAFHAFHPELTRVRKYLNPFYIGDVVENAEDKVEVDQALKDDFEKLRQKAISKNLFRSSPFFFILTCLHILAFEFASYFVIFRYGTGWIPYLTALVLYVIAEVQCGWVQHDFGHLSVFKKSSWNHLLHQFYIGLTKGASADWWNHMHFQHHAKPNVIDKDPDTRVEAVFVLGSNLPKREAEKNAKYGKGLPYDFQYLYFFIAAPLLFPVYFQFMTIRHAYNRGKWMDLAWLGLFYIKYFALMPLKLGFIGAYKLLFLIRVFEGTWFVVVTQSNHVVMDVSHDNAESSWLRMQLKATCNIEKSYFNDWFTGHLNFQIEHHLFPMMPRHNLYKIQSDVMDLCRKYNITYIVKPMGPAFYDILTSLEKSGRMWRETYEELMQASSAEKSNT
jgi:fatty acid desaturase 2 (delta-6 desaturase)